MSGCNRTFFYISRICVEATMSGLPGQVVSVVAYGIEGREVVGSRLGRDEQPFCFFSIFFPPFFVIVLSDLQGETRFPTENKYTLILYSDLLPQKVRFLADTSVLCVIARRKHPLNPSAA